MDLQSCSLFNRKISAILHSHKVAIYDTIKTATIAFNGNANH